MSIGQRIRLTRRERGMSQSELSKRVGLTQATLSDLENDKSRGSAKIASIANALGVRPFWLETGRGVSNLQEAGEPIDELSAEILVYSATGLENGFFTNYESSPISLPSKFISEKSLVIRIKSDTFGGRLWSGDFLIVDPQLPTEPGDIVFAELSDGRRGVWMLRFIRNEEVCLEPLSQREQTMTFNKSEIKSIDKIASILLRQ